MSPSQGFTLVPVEDQGAQVATAPTQGFTLVPVEGDTAVAPPPTSERSVSDVIKERLTTGTLFDDDRPELRGLGLIREKAEAAQSEAQADDRGFIEKITDKPGRLLEQFQKGSEIQTRELGEVLRAGKQTEQLTDVPAPSGFGEKAARLAGEFGPTPALGGVPLAGQGVIQLSNALSSKAAPVMNALAKASKKTTGFVGEVLGGVPAKFFETLIEKTVQGKSPLKQPQKSFGELGKKAQKAINFIDKKAGEAVGAEKLALKNSAKKVDTQPFIDSIDRKIAELEAEGITPLTQEDLNKLNGFKESLSSKEPMSVAKLNVIKQQMDQAVSFSVETVKKASDIGQGVIKSTAGEINESIGKAVPKFKKVKDEFSRIRNLKDRLTSKLKDENVERNMKNLAFRPEFTQDLFKELDELSPKRLKFYEDLQGSTVKEAFDQIFPGTRGGSGSAAGFGNLLRSSGLITSAATTGPAALLAAPAFSPKVQGKVIEGAIGLGKGLSKGVGKAASVLKPLPPGAGIGLVGKSGLGVRRRLNE